MGDHTARAVILARLTAQGAELGHLRDVLDCLPGAPFPARLGLPPRRPCRGITRRGTSCAAPAAIIGPNGYCPWHDPALADARRAWCAVRRGARELRWFARTAARFGGQPIAPQAVYHPDPALHAVPALDLAGLPAGQRRALGALLAAPLGRTYRATAGALGVAPGTLHAQLARIRRRHPDVYAAAMAPRAAQLAWRHEAAAGRARAQRAEDRRRHRARCRREPWARR